MRPSRRILAEGLIAFVPMLLIGLSWGRCPKCPVSAGQVPA